MGLGFGGEVADYYARYRRGYPPAAVDVIAQTFNLGPDDLVLDLGCGTGQLTIPMANRDTDWSRTVRGCPERWFGRAP